MAKRKHLKLADPFNDFYGSEVNERQNVTLKKLTDAKFTQNLNEEYAKNLVLKKDPWQDREFQEMMIECARRWINKVSNKKVELEFIES